MDRGSRGVSRRRFLAGAATGTTLAWATPAVVAVHRAHAAPGSAPSPPDGTGPPLTGGATIVCDGAGGYRVSLGSWAGAPCGIEGCITQHESSHIVDWVRRYPKGCFEADGTTPKPDGTAVPTEGTQDYADFLKASECTAYTTELTCVTALAPTTDDCKDRVKAHKDDTAKQKAKYCG